VLDGGAPLSDFKFRFLRPQSDDVAGVELGFSVTANSTPSTNIHAIIGRNGVGKTTLLNEMVTAVMRPAVAESKFYTKSVFETKKIDQDYFSSLISVSFSAFDPFTPPQEQPDPERGTRYHYIGLKDAADHSGATLKSLPTLREECVASLGECFSDKGKRERWRTAISTLESDENFARMSLHTLMDLVETELKMTAEKLVQRMSAGHAVVLLTMDTSRNRSL
jgi:energy-coupling factor transporter ATP-binding protein EcfA2